MKGTIQANKEKLKLFLYADDRIESSGEEKAVKQPDLLIIPTFRSAWKRRHLLLNVRPELLSAKTLSRTPFNFAGYPQTFPLM